MHLGPLLRLTHNFQEPVGTIIILPVEWSKSIRYNSGNYMSTKLLYTLPVIIKTSSDGLQVPDVQGVSVQALWGFQRTYRRNFYLNLEVGLGVNTYSSEPLGGAAYFTLGYTFPKRS